MRGIEGGIGNMERRFKRGWFLGSFGVFGFNEIWGYFKYFICGWDLMEDLDKF